MGKITIDYQMEVLYKVYDFLTRLPDKDEKASTDESLAAETVEAEGDQDEASLREYGDSKHLIAYVEVDHPAYDSLKRSKRVAWTSRYYDTNNEGRLMAQDFAFRYTNSSDKRDVRNRLEKLLKVKLQKI